MAFYCFYQEHDNQPWQISLASERENLVRRENPPFLISALDSDCDFRSKLSYEESMAVKHRGPVYVDWDSPDISEVIPHVQKFASLLRDKGVDLNCIRWYATGGKGFHAEIPLEVFRDRVPKTGIAALPYIIKEMMYDLAVDFLDFRVYTIRRLWRTPNVKRQNGRYKVPISSSEMMGMTAEMYDRLTLGPREFPPLSPAKFAPVLGVLFQIAEDKVGASIKKRKSSKSSVDLAKRFKGEYPATLKRIMRGEGLNENVGFNRIAMQLAIVATQFGKSEEDLLESCEGLIQGHRGDGGRYNTPRKRREELSRQYRYMDGNPCYEFSVGPLKSLMAHGVDTSDLGAGEYDTTADGATADSPESIARGIKIDKQGFFVNTENGWKKVSDIGMADPVQLVTLEADETIGFEVDVFVEGARKGKRIITMNSMQSKAKFQEWASGVAGTSVQASDAQVALLMDFNRKISAAKNNKLIVVNRMGLDVVVPYGTDPNECDIIWGAKDEVISRVGNMYRLRDVRGKQAGDTSVVSDLHLSPELTKDAEETLHALFDMNSAKNMSLLLGWLFAAFLCQPIRRLFKEFPSLQLFGEMGAGKSKTMQTLLWMHSYAAEIPLIPAGAEREFSVVSSIAQSASVPIVFDEVKPREMRKERLDLMRDVLRNNYPGATIRRGNVNRDSGHSSVEMLKYQNEAPIVFIGEAIESQAAILERSVVVALSKQSRLGHEKQFRIVQGNHTHLSGLGRSCLDAALRKLDMNMLRETVNMNRDRVTKSLGSDAPGRDRPIANIAVVLSGLDFGRQVIRSVFDSEFDEYFERMEAVLLGNAAEVMPEDISEAARVLDVMAQMSYGRFDAEHTLVQGKEYTVSDDGRFIDIALKPAFAKYQRYCASLRQTPLYDSQMAFITAMRHYGGTVATSCRDNKDLYVNPLSVVFRFKVEALEREQVEPFRCV